MHYGIYKNLRGGAWSCLIQSEIDSFPVDVLKITRKAGIRVVKNSLVNDLMPNEDAKSYFNGQAWIVIYNDKNPVPVSRFAIAHELGHFFLGHDLTHSRYECAQKFGSKPKAEEQADAFAMRLLAPACVIKELDLYTAEEIAQYCGIPLDMAKTRANRMKILYKRDMFFTDPLEAEVYESFRAYVNKVKRSKGKKSKSTKN